jgi:glycerol kinase
LYNIQDYTWDHELLEIFDVQDTLLPDVFPTSGHFGSTDPRVTDGVSIPIMSMVGDQQSALYGQKCWRPGNCKNTFGTGAFLMMNLGDQFLLSSKGLLTTIACDPEGKPAYALEGAVFIAGAALEWLKDQMGIISTFEEADKLAKSIKTNEGVYMVPAFVGLGAPYWRGDVRGTMSGLTQGTTRAHFARAALESMAYQSDDVVTQMQRAARMSLEALKVDGGVTRSNFLMQFLANLIDVPVQRMADPDLTAKGAGFLAGLASGFWRSFAEIEALPEEIEEFKPKMNEEVRRQYRIGWEQAIYKTLAVEIKLDNDDDDEASEEESQEQMVI